MAKIIIDGTELDVPPELTLLQAAEVAGAEIIPFEIEPIAIDDLANGNGAALDAVLLGLLAAQDAIGIGKAVEIVGPPLFSQPFVMAAGTDDGDFAASIAAAVESLRADGTLARLSVAHLGIDAAPPP